MEDIKKFEKYSQEDQKKINGLKGEITKRDQKIAVLLEEIKALRKLSKMPTEDQMVREVAKRELAMQEKQSIKKRRYEAPKKIRAMKQVDFQESEEEEEEGDSEESSGEELMQRVIKRKKKSRRAVKESEVSTEESSSDEDEKPAKKKHKKKNKVSDYIKKKSK